jgi:hypothetical protein
MEEVTQSDREGHHRRRHHHRPRHDRLMRRIRRRLGPGKLRQILLIAFLLLLLAFVVLRFVQHVAQPPPIPIE